MTFHYAGSELDLFAQALRWKQYFAERLAPFVRGRVLEIGAGIGANIPYLWSDRVAEWLSVEPDPVLAGRLVAGIPPGIGPQACRTVCGTIDDVAPTPGFDTILYLDVLEHIEDDAAELRKAAAHLADAGHIVVLAPAYPILYTPFDRAIGHYRRYTAARVPEITPEGCNLTACFMLDSVGLLASVGNRFILRSSMPTPEQIRFWDERLVPLSRRLDRLFRNRVGKSLVAVWTRCKLAAPSGSICDGRR